MKFKYLLITIGLLSFCFNFSANSQGFVDLAQQFSQREISGSARMQGMGGASASLGGDITSVIGNPAGLGFFNRSEFSFSPSLGFHNTDTKFLGQGTKDYKTNFNFGHLGVVLNNTKPNTDQAWKGGSFAVSMTRINDFHSQVRYSGKNSINDFIGYTIGEANQSASSNSVNADPGKFLPDLSYLAYSTYLIDPYESADGTHLEFDSSIEFPTEEYPVTQSESIITTGAGYTTSFSYGGNFADKLYLGGGVSFTSINYEITRVYKEAPSETILNNLVLAESREIRGSGFNVSLGTIYRPISALTIGVSYTSPTYYSFDDAGRIDLVANFKDSTHSEGVDYPPFQYEYRSPSHLNGGVSYFIGKNGFITADVEYVNYGGNKYSSNQDDFSLDNRDIESTMRSVVNYKIGGEYRLNLFRFRAGYAFFADPIASSNVDRSRNSFSLGAGLRLRDYYVDLAVVNTRYESSYIPYADGPLAVVDNNFTRAMLTIGFNF